MVTTRSTRSSTRSSTKHKAPKAENEAPAKKQKVSKDTKGAEGNSKAAEKQDKKPEVTIEPESKTDTKELKRSNRKKESGKPSAVEPEAAKAEHETTGGAQRESKESGYLHQQLH